jgi:hypothetical protein
VWVSNIYFTRPGFTGQRLDIYDDNATYATRLDPAYPTTKIATGQIGAGGGLRGHGAFDGQVLRTFGLTYAGHVASGTASVIAGGKDNSAPGNYSWVPGGTYATTRSRRGSWAWSSDTGTIGANQCSGISLQALTADATPVVMVSDAAGTTASATNQLSVPSGVAVHFSALVTARSGGVCKAWKLEGLLRNLSGTTALVGSVTKTVIAESTGAETWDVAATASSTVKAAMPFGTGTPHRLSSSLA